MQEERKQEPSEGQKEVRKIMLTLYELAIASKQLAVDCLEEEWKEAAEDLSALKKEREKVLQLWTEQQKAKEASNDNDSKLV